MIELTRRRLLAAAAGAAATSALPGCSSGASAPVPEDVLAFHRDCLVLDLHVDTLLWMRTLGYDFTARHENHLPRAPFGWHVDLPRAREGGLDAGVMGLVINPRVVRSELMFPLKFLAWMEKLRGIDQTLATLDLWEATARAHPDQIVFARSGSDVRRAVAEGKFAGLAGLEGSQGIEGSLEHARTAYDRGLRMLGLVHFQATEAAYPMTVATFDGQGLTEFGRSLVAECERLGMVVDVAHLNAAGVQDVLTLAKRPFVVSHSACRALQDNARNLDDDQLRAIADRGGVIGVAAGLNFVGRNSLEGYVDHVEHVIRVAGADAAAIGSDWDGFILPVRGMEDVRCLPRITQSLLARGQPRDAVRKFLGENALRVLTEVCG